MAFDARDERFAEVIEAGAQVLPVVTGLGITEGTTWHPRDQYLVFTDLSSGTVYRWTAQDGPAILRKPSNITNGTFVDRQGRILCCEHATSSVSRIETDGRYLRVLASHYRGKEFNSPNDIVCDRQDRIWFTDPLFGRTSPRVGVARPPQLGFQGVFRLETDGEVTLVADDFDQPNGLCLVPGEQALLVNDTATGAIRRFEVHPDGRVTGGAVFATIAGEGEGKADGIKVDTAGRVYCTGPGGVHVLAPDGALLGVITAPGNTRNFCFGGREMRTLFLAVQGGIWQVAMRATGVGPPMAP